MKRPLLIVLLCVLAVLAAIAGVYVVSTARAEAHKDAILSVFKQAEFAHTKATIPGNMRGSRGRGPSSFNARQFAADLNNISTDACPFDFQTAWHKFAAAIRSQAETEKTDALQDAFSLFHANAPNRIIDKANAIQAAADELHDVCLRYHVTMQ